MNKRKSSQKLSNNKKSIYSEASEATIDNEINPHEQRYSESTQGEDLMQNVEDDYKHIPELDKQDSEVCDDDEYSEMEEEDRIEADILLDQNEKEKLMDNLRKNPNQLNRVPNILLADEEELNQRYEKDDSNYDNLETQNASMAISQRLRNIGLISNEANIPNIEDPGSPRGDNKEQWLLEDRVQNFIKYKFARFLKSYKDYNNSLQQIKQIDSCVISNKRSIEVKVNHLQEANLTHFVIWLSDFPAIMLSAFHSAAFMVLYEMHPNYAKLLSTGTYSSEQGIPEGDLYVRISNYPIEDALRKLRFSQIAKFIKIKGVITKRTAVLPQLRKVMYKCKICGDFKGPILVSEIDNLKPGECIQCNKSTLTLDSEKTLQRNFQKMNIQELPGQVEAGRVPRRQEIWVLHDLVDSIKPGDDVEISGIQSMRWDYSNIQQGFPVYDTHILVNHIKKCFEVALSEISLDDIYKIKELSKKSDIQEKIITSVAPSLSGLRSAKQAIALSIFGGEPKEIQNKHRIRGDINVLLLGDPGVAKSQLLKWVSNSMSKCVQTSGKGASAVGLTAACTRDPITKEWALEGGALVMADKGVCCIDEFDKMNEVDRSSIHEAMEQQAVSVAKAGIVATLQARSAVIAAANPIRGRYDPQIPFSENVDLSDPIISRFDILCVLKDEPNEIHDQKLATHVLNSHCMAIGMESMLDEIESDENKHSSIDQELFKKQVLYAKKHIHPTISNINVNKLSNFYATLRKEASQSGGIAIAVRHIESIIRISEAQAKMHLKNNVTDADIDFGIRVVLNSFLNTQKLSVMKILQRKFSEYLKEFSPYLVNHNSINEYLFNVLGKLVSSKRGGRNIDQYSDLIKIDLHRFENEAQNVTGLGNEDIKTFYDTPIFRNQQYIDRECICKKI